ncbi:hypothetical protein ACE4RU_05605 [Actinobacillus seminis]|uniref:hypothetical protein n=1 Tax=Actinobacillus seminis TaxID=722 RepID=UPI003B9518C1
MSKKTKITFTLSAIALALTVGAQFYTNYKIDRELQKFPYTLRDQLTLNVTQIKSNFFSRELMFSISDTASHKTNIIHTNLTALPFAITAESELPAELIKDLNKKWQVTIDKSVINSKFSVIGDYLQSDIVTQFRDLTNKPQELEVNLNFASKTKFMEIKSRLSGFYYDTNSNIKDLNANLTLIPIRQNQYDLSDLEVKLSNADIYLLNGDNTHIELDKTNYQLNKSFYTDTYDLNTKLDTEKLLISNKNNPQDKIQLNGLRLTLAQIGVPNHLLFGNILDTVNKDKIDYQKTLQLLLDLFYNSKKLQFDIATQTATLPNGQAKLNLNNVSLATKANFENPQNAEIENNVTADSITQQYAKKEDTISISGLEFSSKLMQIDISKHSELLKYKLNSMLNVFQEKKSHTQLAELLKNISQNFQEKTQWQLKINSFVYPHVFNIEGFDLNYIEEPTNEQEYLVNISGNLDKLIDEYQAYQLNNIKAELPFKLTQANYLIPIYICESYSLNCSTNLSNEDYNKLLLDIFKNVALKTENITFHFNIDTYPNTRGEDVSINGNLTLPALDSARSQSIHNESDALNEKINAMTAMLNVTFPATLVELNDKKSSPFWQEFVLNIKPNEINGVDNPFFLLEGGNYSFKYEQQPEQQISINGKPLNQIPAASPNEIPQKMLATPENMPAVPELKQ